MNITELISKIRQQPQSVMFAEVIQTIDQNYVFTPTAFSNGEQLNPANTNNGSCKIFAFAQLHGLSINETLACFGDYYRKDVLEHPAAQDHANIRNFMRSGWDGIHFSAPALQAIVKTVES